MMTMVDNTTVKYKGAESEIDQENAQEGDDFEREDNEIGIGFMKKGFK
jgi:hypothetical protein